MAEVRRATPADLDELLEMGAAMHAESPAYRDEPFEPDIVRRWLMQRMSSTLLVDDSAVFVAMGPDGITGVMIGFVADRWFNRRRFAAELILYVRPQHRGGRTLPRLVQAFEAWARAQGASKATIGTSTGIHAQRTVHTYGRLGYTLDGHNATKVL